MSDDKERRRPDETSEFFPFEDEGENRPNDGPPTEEWDSDRTEQMPRATEDTDSTQTFPAADEDATRVTPRAPQSDATSVLPAAQDSGTHTERYDRNTNWGDDGDPAWSGRAGVRPPRPGSSDDFTRTDWAAVPSDEPHGRWWAPIAVGIVALLLLGLLGWGIYLIVQSAGDDGPGTPAVTASPAAPATTTEPATEPPSTAPTTTQPTSSPPTSSSDVTVPALKGLSTEEAAAALNRKGLSYRLRFVTSDSPPGTVIDSDPAEGQQVPADTVITLIIAAEPTTPAAPTETTTETTDQQDEN